MILASYLKLYGIILDGKIYINHKRLWGGWAKNLPISTGYGGGDMSVNYLIYVWTFTICQN